MAKKDLVKTGNWDSNEIYSHWGVTFNASVLDIPGFTFDKYFSLLQKNISIVSNWCWGGITYHYFSHKFLSPFINMFVEDDEYLRLLRSFDYYMKQSIDYSYMRYDIPTNGMDGSYPVGVLGDIHINMNHYATWDEACDKWEERKKRMNSENTLFVMITSSMDAAREFDAISLKNKIGHNCRALCKMVRYSSNESSL